MTRSSTDASVGAIGQDVARVRAALLLVDTAPLAEMVQRMQPLADGTGPMRHSARQILALAQFKAGDKAAANKIARSITGRSRDPSGDPQPGPTDPHPDRRSRSRLRALAEGGRLAPDLPHGSVRGHVGKPFISWKRRNVISRS